jgi:hypothetical protein
MDVFSLGGGVSVEGPISCEILTLIDEKNNIICCKNARIIIITANIINKINGKTEYRLIPLPLDKIYIIPPKRHKIAIILNAIIEYITGV